MKVTFKKAKEALEELCFDITYIDESDIVFELTENLELPFRLYRHVLRYEETEISEPVLVFQDEYGYKQVFNYKYNHYGEFLNWTSPIKVEEDGFLHLSDEYIKDLTDKINTVLEYIERHNDRITNQSRMGESSE